MAPYSYLLAFLGAIGPSIARAAPTTSANSTVNLFVIEPTGTDPIPTVYASIIRVVPSLSQTAYYISCRTETSDDNEEFGLPPSGPCKHIDGASVTVDPTAMTLRLGRESQLITAEDFETQTETWVDVSATATCALSGTASASCAGHMTSSATVFTHLQLPADSTWGMSSGVDVETIDTQFADVTAHYVPVTVTAGFDKIAAAQSTTTARSTSSSTGGGAVGPRATGVVGLAGVAGVVAVVGGVVLG